MSTKITILHLYPDRMSIYGDYGNILCLTKRATMRDIEVEYITNTIGEKLTKKADLIFFGGGQDSGQNYVSKDILGKSSYISEHFNDNRPILAVCGGYQLLGNSFITSEKANLKGVGVFNVVTKATEYRMIGNIVVDSEKFGKIVGFENHSGSTEILDDSSALGRVVSGYGNSRYSKQEGIFVKNAIGTYLHGPILPKNPAIADYLLQKAIQVNGHNIELNELDDWLETKARDYILKNKK